MERVGMKEETISFHTFGVRFRCGLPFTGFVDGIGYAYAFENPDGTYHQTLDIRYGIEKIETEARKSVYGDESAPTKLVSGKTSIEIPVAKRDATYNARIDEIKKVVTENIIIRELQKFFTKLNEAVPSWAGNAVSGVSTSSSIVGYSMYRGIKKEFRKAGILKYKYDPKSGDFIIKKTDCLFDAANRVSRPYSIENPLKPLNVRSIETKTAGKIGYRCGILGKGCAAVSLVLILADAASCNEFQKHHLMDLGVLGVGLVLGGMFPLAGMAFGLAYFVGDIATQCITGQTLSEYICGDNVPSTPSSYVPANARKIPEFRQGR